ncbi:hypothetical protein A343_1875 [Porphyromonas gingivalis JCVI SC001]|nr:hypothetical protein A343_1875 [Porphyromonas gingivalis JCVI SC001]
MVNHEADVAEVFCTRVIDYDAEPLSVWVCVETSCVILQGERVQNFFLAVHFYFAEACIGAVPSLHS